MDNNTFVKLSNSLPIYDVCDILIVGGKATGQAANVAAKNESHVRNVNIKKVQDILVEQGVPLRRHDKVDPYYTACCEEHGYGLYTDLAKRTREERIEDFCQW